MHVNPLIDRETLTDVLTKVLDRTSPYINQKEYCLIGTAAALLRGVTLPVGDIDILVRRRKTVDHISKSLKEYELIIPPTELHDMNQYYTEYSIDEIEVGISTVEIDTENDWIETYGPGPWTHYTLQPCGHYIVPTIKLEIRLLTELLRNRPERYNPIIKYLEKHEIDRELVKRGIKGLHLEAYMDAVSPLNLYHT